MSSERIEKKESYKTVNEFFQEFLERLEKNQKDRPGGLRQGEQIKQLARDVTRGVEDLSKILNERQRAYIRTTLENMGTGLGDKLDSLVSQDPLKDFAVCSMIVATYINGLSQR